MSLESIILRYPAGEQASVFGEITPQEGDEMTHEGDTWIIEEVTEGEDGAVTVRARPAPRRLPPLEDEEPE